MKHKDVEGNLTTSNVEFMSRMMVLTIWNLVGNESRF
jgi:hypothetical protein